MTSCVQEGRKPTADAEIASQVPLPAETAEEIVQMSIHPETRAFKGPLDFPSISNWLKACEEDLERGRDGHHYTLLSLMFTSNGCTRIDDITRMSPADIKALAGERDLDATVGLVNRVHQYATEDVVRNWLTFQIYRLM